jgi:citrate lyase beta subunit
MRFLQLGASLYVPATRPDLAAIANCEKYPQLRSVIFCTEDAVHPCHLALALDHLANLLQRLEPAPLLRFIRVRSPAVLRTLVQMPGIRQINGFVLPKVTRANLEEYWSAFQPDDPFEVMLTLETADVFDADAMKALRTVLLQERYRRRILSLRIGGNDLLHLLGLRRPRGQTIYATPLRAIIGQLVTVFRPHGFNLTAPVFDYLDTNAILCREVKRDLLYGLFGKTAIHPQQVPLIERHYRVRQQELQMAEKILAHGAPAVFRWHNAMCEPATHRTWAALIHERARIFGVAGDSGPPREHEWPQRDAAG